MQGKFTNRQYAIILDKLVSELGEDKAIDKFIDLLRSFNSLNGLNSILSEYEKQVRERSTLEVTSARPLTDSQKSKLKEIFGSEIKIVEKEDKSLIAGFVVKTDRYIFDISAQDKLNRIKQSLLN